MIEDNTNLSENNLVELFKKYNLHTPIFNLKNKSCAGRVVDIIDGDTMIVILPLFNNYYKFTIRLSDIDTYELKSENIILHNHGIKARNRVLELLLMTNKYKEVLNIEDELSRKQIQNICDENVLLVYVECFGYDKYGRVLGKIYLKKEKKQEECISQILIKEKLAYEYNGSSKMSEEEQLERLNLK